MLDLTAYDRLTVQQVVEGMEVFTGLETQNRYQVSTAEGEPLLYAYEESGFMGRQFLSTHRPLTLHVVESDGSRILTASRGFFFFLSHLHIRDGDGRAIGSLHRRFTVLKRRFTLTGPSGQALATVEGPLLKPNTFMVKRDDQETARITKQWSGLLREGFSRADTFAIEHSGPHDQDFSLLTLATALAIDLDFFEDRPRRR